MNVEAILTDYNIEILPVGKRFMVCCPYHNDTDPSCGIWQDSGYFKCFGCGAEGSLIDYLMEYSGETLHQVLRNTKEHQDSVGDIEGTLQKVLDRDTTEFKYLSFKSFLKTYGPVRKNTKAWEYLQGRKITWDSVKRFRMRWGGTEGKYRNRVILPIMSVDNRLIAYVGRTILEDIQPKTKKNRPPHRTFFGLKELLEMTKMEKVPYLIIVEGEFDAIYLQQFGIPAVANMGTMEINPFKILLLRKYAERVILSYDPDDAGKHAVYGSKKRKGELELLSPHLPTTALRLPKGYDPNALSERAVNNIYGEWRMECLIL